MISWHLFPQNHYSKIIFTCQKSFLFIDFFIEMSAQMPAQMPVEMPSPMPTWMFVEMPVQMPVQISVEMPAQMPAQMSTWICAQILYICKNLNSNQQHCCLTNETEQKTL